MLYISTNIQTFRCAFFFRLPSNITVKCNKFTNRLPKNHSFSSKSLTDPGRHKTTCQIKCIKVYGEVLWRKSKLHSNNKQLKHMVIKWSGTAHICVKRFFTKYFSNLRSLHDRLFGADYFLDIFVHI